MLLIVVLATLTILFSLYPVISVGKKGVFYSIDPDIHYYGNSLAFIEKGTVYYTDHPGTPTIVLHTLLLTPLRVYSNLLLHESFMDWAFRNYSAVFLYARFFQGLIFFSGLIVFLLTIREITKSCFAVVFAWLAVLAFSPAIYLGSSISAGALSFLTVSVWLFALSNFLKERSLTYIPILSLIAGFAVANKITNLFLVAATLSLNFFPRQVNLSEKTKNLLYSTFLAALGFIAGTLPVLHKYRNVFRRFWIFATSTKIHGGGERSLLDIPSYLASVRTLLVREEWIFYFMAGAVLVSVFLVIVNKRKLFSVSNVLLVIFLAGVAIFAKFDLSHYQLANYTAIVFLGLWKIRKAPNIVFLLITFLAISAASTNIAKYSAYVLKTGQKVKNLEEFISKNPAKKGTVWEWGKSKDFALLWTRDWGAGVFSDQLSALSPPLMIVNTGWETVKVGRESKDTFDVCWDKMYIQDSSLPKFLDRYPEREFKRVNIPGNEKMVLLESDHCEVLQN